MARASTNSAIRAAIEHHKSGRSSEAEALYRRVLQEEPNHADALNLLGILSGEQGHYEAAVDLIGRAVAAYPSVAEYHASLGETYRRMGKLESAEASLRKALELRPADADANNSLGLVFQSRGLTDQAIAAFSEAVRIRPDFVLAHNNLGIAWSDNREFEKAVSAFQRSLELIPDQANIHMNLGACRLHQDQIEKGIAAYRRAIKLEPELEEAHKQLGTAYFYQGDLPRGFAEYEWRLKGEKAVISSSIPQPRWDGGDLNGKTILLHGEQGFGDLIQAARYVPLVAAKHGRIVIGCYPELVRLFADLPYVEKITKIGEVASPFDVYCPFMSLPLAFGTTLLSIPAYVPYLYPKPDLVRTWSQRLGPRDGKVRVGLVWAGRGEHENDRNRSIRLNQLACLKDVSGVSFYSLQKGPAGAQIADSVFAGHLIDWTTDLNDFVDTAALLANLDLLIAVDTAVVHLAGAMGKAVWLLLPTPPDWRWMLRRPDSPWYPTIRLFRQKREGDWGEIITEMREALAMTGQQRAPAV